VIKGRKLALLFLLLSCARERVRPNVLLITLDTFRADRITAQTPNLQKLANESVTFKNADSPVPLTLPAHCSILSGVLPLHHGVRNNGANPFPSDRADLATVLSAAGYRTGAFVSAFVLDRRFGLNRGFETYDDEIARDDSNSLEAERRGEVTVDRALTWLRANDARPFFAWVHLYDAHTPYEKTYDDDIRTVDAQVGRLLAAIDRTKTIVAVVGDHGESLGEHDESTHGLLLYESTLHVPMIIAAPDVKPREVKSPVSTIDLAPTLASLAGAKLDGRILPLDREPSQTDIYAETEYPLQFGWSSLASLRRGDDKLISNRELYDVANDPAEKVNRLDAKRREFRRLEDALNAIRRTAVASTPTVVGEETRRKLASLGYVAPTANPTREGAFPDPAKMAPLFSRFENAKDSIAALEQLVKDDPRNPVFRSTLARELRKKGNVEAAIKLYREAVALAPNDADAWYNLAVALQEAGHAEEGSIAIQESLRRNAQRPEAHNALGIALMNEGNVAAGEAEFRAALSIDPRDARTLNNLGNALRATNRFAEAREAYTQAIGLAPSYPDPLNGLGVVDVQEGHARDAIAKFDAALRIAPDYYEAQLNRGIALEESGDKAAAADQFRRLLAALPPGPEHDAQRKAAQTLLAR
jgi:arylsulfatase A-like enzyme/Flp pilus assembly protein TadD